MSNHLHEKIDFTADVFIIHNGKVLLRLHDKYNMWFGIGGHIEPDEDPVQTAIREAKEEVGLDIHLVGENKILSDGTTELITPFFMNRHQVNDSHEHINLIYFARADSDIIIEEESEKSGGCKWLSLEEVENSKEIIDRIKTYAIGALKTVI